MDTEKEIHSLSAETLALTLIVSNVLSKLAKIPELRSAIIEGFDQSSDVAESVAVHFGKAASSEHTIKALRIIEETRAMVIGAGEGPKSRV
jgi:hypothetical protein